MVNTATARRSPLFETYSTGDYGHVSNNQPGVSLSERVALNIVQVDAWQEQVGKVLSLIENITGVRPSQDACIATQSEKTVALWLGPDRWLLVEKEQRDLERVILERLTPDMAAVTDQSHSRCVIRLSGKEARNVLRKGTTLDLDKSYYKINEVKTTSLFHMNALIHCLGEDRFDIYIARSFGQSFFEVITHAAAEFGYRVEDPL